MAQITTTQKLKFTFTPTTEGTSTNPNGLPAPIDGDVAWTLEGNNTSGATLVPVDGSAGKNEAYFISGDTPQTDALTVKAVADADVDGEGEVREISATDTMTVIAAEAAGGGLLAGTPEPK